MPDRQGNPTAEIGQTLTLLLGHVVAVGTPQEIAATPQSYTGQYLKQALDRRRKTKRAAQAAEQAAVRA